MNLDLIRTFITLGFLGFLAVEDLRNREMHDLPLITYAILNPTLTLIQYIRDKPGFLGSIGIALSSIIVVTFGVLYCFGAVADGDLLMSLGLYLGHPWPPWDDGYFPFPLMVMSFSLLCLLLHAATTGWFMLGKKMTKEEAMAHWRDRYIVILGDGRRGGKDLLLGANGEVKILDPPPFVFHSYIGFLCALAVTLITRLFN